MQIIRKSQLEKWISQKTDLLIIDILSKENFDSRRIPGAINIPFKNDENFICEVEKRVLSKDGRIVIYCLNKQCPLSSQAAGKLDNAGFANVYYLKEGIEGWFAKSKNVAA